MLDSVVADAAFRTGRRLSTPGAGFVGVEVLTMAGPQLTQDGLSMTRKIFRSFVDFGKISAEKVVVGVATNGAFDEGRVDTLLRCRVGTWLNGAINKERRDLLQASILKQLLHIARTLRGSRLLEGWVIFTQGARQKLRC